ncbi:MAG TPA: dCTP deaminase [Solirubrobacteraceae bacterium]|nr:dCTP deaminase [Solirubrobacteraceae bacterium]
MLLGREDLNDALESRRLIVTPILDQRQIGRGAIDLRLGTEFLLLQRTRRAGLNPAVENQREVDELQERVVVQYGEELWLHPRHFVLAATLEFLRLPADLCAYVVGRSSWGRLGLVVATAVFVHPEFRGCLTLELVNEGDSPICLSPGARIAQLAVHRLERPAESSPGEEEKYRAPVRPQPSRLASEHEHAEFRKLSALGDTLRSRLG